MTYQLRPASLAVLACLSTGYSNLASASGFQFPSTSASAQGTSHANSAEAADASTIFANPAGMMRLDGNQRTDALQVLVPKSTYTDNGTVNVEGKIPRAAAAPARSCRPWPPVPSSTWSKTWTTTPAWVLACSLPMAPSCATRTTG